MWLLWLSSGEPILPRGSSVARRAGSGVRPPGCDFWLHFWELWECGNAYLTLCLHSLTWKPHTHFTGLKIDIWKVLNPSRSSKGDTSRLSSNYPSQPHSMVEGKWREDRQVSPHIVFSPRRGISVKHDSRHTFMFFPFPLSLKGFEQEIVSRIRSNKEQGQLVWYDPCWPNIHVGPKPALLTHPLSTRDCLGQHPSVFQKLKIWGKKNVPTLPKSISLLSDSIVWEQSVKGWDSSFIIAWCGQLYSRASSKIFPKTFCLSKELTLGPHACTHLSLS